MKQIFPGFITCNISQLPDFKKIQPLLNALCLIPDNYKGLCNSETIKEERLKLNFLPEIKLLDKLEFEDTRIKENNKFESDIGNSRTCYDIKNKTASLISLITIQLSKILDDNITNEGMFFYPKKGFRGWHTNKYDKLGWRMYLVLSKNENASFFRAVNPSTNKIETVWDISGRVNFFHVREVNPIWHCIAADNENRWSCGFMLKTKTVKKLTAKVYE